MYYVIQSHEKLKEKFLTGPCLFTYTGGCCQSVDVPSRDGIVQLDGIIGRQDRKPARGREAMLTDSNYYRSAAKKYSRLLLWATVVAAALPFLGSAARAQGQTAADPPALRLIKIIPINGTSASPKTKMFSFDISFVDPTPIPGHPLGLYYLADRSNAALDVIDIATETLFGQIGGNGVGQANFNGDTGTTATSGPDGVAALFPCIFAGDGDSRLLSFNGAVDFTKVVSAMSTGGTMRVDEMAIDPAPGQTTGLVIAANNADSPPFTTIFTFNKTTCALSNPIKTTFTTLPG